MLLGVAALLVVGTSLGLVRSNTVMATFYVSPTGNNTNPGTKAAPFATIHKARDVVRSRRSAMRGDIVVYLRGGTYALSKSLTLTSQDSGTNGFEILYTSYPGERAVLSGGSRVQGWSLYDADRNLYRSQVGTELDTRQLYVNGVKARRARSSRDPPGFTVTPSGFDVANAAMTNWRNLTEVELVGYHLWRDFYCRIGGISHSHITVQEPCWTRSQTSLVDWKFDRVAYIENAWEVLDQPGEWYYDRAAGYLYYIPQKGEDMATAEVVVPRLGKLVDGQGTVSAPVSHIVFNGLTFAYAGWTEPSSAEGYVAIQTGYHLRTAGDRLVSGNVHFTTARHVTFRNNVFAHLGGAGLNLERASQNITIHANRFEDIASNAISLGNVNDNAETKPVNQSRFYDVRNNYITRTGFEYPDASGIMGGYLDSATIQHNEIYDISHSPLTVGWGWGASSYAKNNNIGYNYLHRFTQILEDSAGIYTLGPQPGTEIHHNHVDQAIHLYGCLYPDEGSAYMNWHHNVCQRVPQWLHLAAASVHDNQVQYNYADTTMMENSGTNNTVQDNTFVTAENWAARANSIMQAAGIQTSHLYVKNLPLPG